MKKIVFFCLLYSLLLNYGLLQAQNTAAVYKYIIVSAQANNLQLFDAQKNSRSCLEPWQRNGGGYLVIAANPSAFWLQNISSDTTACKIYDLHNDKVSESVYLYPQQKMTLTAAFEQHNKGNSFWSLAETYWGRVSDFIRSTQSVSIQQGNNMVLQSSIPDTLSFEWTSPSGTEFLSLSEVRLDWRAATTPDSLFLLDALCRRIAAFEPPASASFMYLPPSLLQYGHSYFVLPYYQPQPHIATLRPLYFNIIDEAAHAQLETFLKKQ